MTLMPRACLKPSQSTIPCSDGGIAVPGQSRCRNHMYKHGWGKYALKHPERAAFYASAHWRERRAGWLLANPDCVVCGEPATAADHIVNLASGGTFDGPLQSLCAAHHKVKTQNESKEGNRRAARRRKQGGSNVRRLRS
jgi:5-methylcytosine-specific restriction enzyme A